ncbi:unnamed protein product [Brassicogethes aeneus]|uniref:Uncharacterized protein n=1 Tax=Brassicogethes aeneus TaxID=1431903 RepID=A0A9P0BEB6_BRAAE|nr:unnamed protein product [Brassicogethes aeneus]
MNPFAVVFAICCLATAQARPGHIGGGEHYQLEGVPGVDAYGKTQYPQFNIIELGEYSKGQLPPATIVSNKQITIKVPQPYPVKVPHPVHVPVPVAKPYPVIQTKIVQVPQHVPYEVIKRVPVPVEVPKPYPVPANEHHSHQSQENFGGSFEGAFGGHNAVSNSYGVPGHQQGTPLGEGQYAQQENHHQSGYDGAQQGGYHIFEQSDHGRAEENNYGGSEQNSFDNEYNNFGGQHSESDQSVRYAAYEQPQQQNEQHQQVAENEQEKKEEN